VNTLTTEERKRICNHFQTHVDCSSRQAMVDFLSSHFRYDTMNSWNRSTSYAHDIKIYRGIGLPDDIDDVKWDMVFHEEWGDHLIGLLDLFDECHDHNWQAGTNGRSGGYLVLYQGGRKNGKIVSYPGRSVDQGEDFHDWDIDQLRAKVDLVCDFDMLAADLVIEFADFCRTYNVVEETIMVHKKIRVLKEKPE